MKTRMTKRLLSFLLATLMATSMLPGNALAGTGTAGDPFVHDGNLNITTPTSGDTGNTAQFPVYPDPGAIFTYKDAGWEDNTYARVGLTVAGIPAPKGVDVVVVLDKTGSMTYTFGCMNPDHYRTFIFKKTVSYQYSTSSSGGNWVTDTRELTVSIREHKASNSSTYYREGATVEGYLKTTTNGTEIQRYRRADGYTEWNANQWVSSDSSKNYLRAVFRNERSNTVGGTSITFPTDNDDLPNFNPNYTDSHGYNTSTAGGCISKSAALRSAATDFIDTLFTPFTYTDKEGQLHSVASDNRLAVVSFNTTAQKHGVSDYFYSVSGKDTLKGFVNAVDGVVDQATYYATALDAARSVINGRTNKTRDVFVVFMSDGAPSNSGTTETAATRTTAATNLKAAANGIYTIGFLVNAAGKNELEKIVESPGYYVSASNKAELTTAFNVIAAALKQAGKDAVVTDEISQYFNLVFDASHPITITHGSGAPIVITTTAQATANGITLSKNGLNDVVKWTVGNITQQETKIEYYVKIRSGTAGDASYPTNTYARVDYTNYNDKSSRMFFREPTLPYPGGQIRVVYLRVNAEGVPIAADGTPLYELSAIFAGAKLGEYYRDSSGALVPGGRNLTFGTYDVTAAPTITVAGGTYSLLNGGTIGAIPTGTTSTATVPVTIAAGEHAVKVVYYGYCPKSSLTVTKDVLDYQGNPTTDTTGFTINVKGTGLPDIGVSRTITEGVVTEIPGVVAGGTYTISETSETGYIMYVNGSPVTEPNNKVTVTLSYSGIDIAQYVTITNRQQVQSYKVEYYKDDISVAGNKLGELTGLAKAVGTQLTDEIIAGDLDDGATSWLDRYKPSGYQSGVNQTIPLPVISFDAANNVVKVLYLKASYTYSETHVYDGVVDAAYTVNESRAFGASIDSAKHDKVGFTLTGITTNAGTKDETAGTVTGTMPAGNVEVVYVYTRNSYKLTVQHVYYDGDVVADTTQTSESVTFSTEVTKGQLERQYYTLGTAESDITVDPTTAGTGNLAAKNATVVMPAGDVTITFKYYRDSADLIVTKEYIGGLTHDPVDVKLQVYSILSGWQDMDGRTATLAATNDPAWTAVFADLECGYTYRVVEIDVPTGYSDSYSPETVLLTKEGAEIAITNTRDLGELEIIKYARGGHSDDEFKFLVTFTGLDALELEVTDARGNRTETVVDGAIYVYATVGTKAVISGIPTGAGYTVEEVEIPSGYKLELVNLIAVDPQDADSYIALGTITTDGASAKFSNSYSGGSFVKEADKTIYEDSETIYYTIKFSNTGNTTLTNLIVTDDKAGFTQTVDTLEPGKTLVFSGLTDAELADRGVIGEQYIIFSEIELLQYEVATTDTVVKNTAKITYLDGEQEKSVTADNIVKVARIEVIKEVNKLNFFAGQTATYTITVTNTGAVDLVNVVVTDEALGFSDAIDKLGIGESEVYDSGLSYLTNAEVLSFTNTAEATGQYETGKVEDDVPVMGEVYDDDSVAIQVVTLTAGQIAVSKSVEASRFSPELDLTYAFELELELQNWQPDYTTPAYAAARELESKYSDASALLEALGYTADDANRYSELYRSLTEAIDALEDIDAIKGAAEAAKDAVINDAKAAAGQVAYDALIDGFKADAKLAAYDEAFGAFDLAAAEAGELDAIASAEADDAEALGLDWQEAYDAAAGNQTNIDTAKARAEAARNEAAKGAATAAETGFAASAEQEILAEAARTDAMTDFVPDTKTLEEAQDAYDATFDGADGIAQLHEAFDAEEAVIKHKEYLRLKGESDKAYDSWQNELARVGAELGEVQGGDGIIAPQGVDGPVAGEGTLTYTLYLKDGENVIFSGVPDGTAYRLNEIGYLGGESGEQIIGFDDGTYPTVQLINGEFVNEENTGGTTETGSGTLLEYTNIYNTLTVMKRFSGTSSKFEVTVQLYNVVEGERVAVGDPVKLNAGNDWIHIYRDLEDGEYIVLETSRHANYRTSYSNGTATLVYSIEGLQLTGEITVTNTYQPPTPDDNQYTYRVVHEYYVVDADGVRSFVGSTGPSSFTTESRTVNSSSIARVSQYNGDQYGFESIDPEGTVTVSGSVVTFTLTYTRTVFEETQPPLIDVPTEPDTPVEDPPGRVHGARDTVG